MPLRWLLSTPAMPAATKSIGLQQQIYIYICLRPQDNKPHSVF